MSYYTGGTKRGQTIAAKSVIEHHDHYEQVRDEDEYAITQQCLIRDRSERAIERMNDEAYETSQAKPHDEVAAASRDHKTATARSEEPESSCLRGVTGNVPDCLRHDKRSANARHPTGPATARTGNGAGRAAAEEIETAMQKVKRGCINTRAPLKRRRNIIAGLLSVVDTDHADDTFPASGWLKYASARVDRRKWLPCVKCRKGDRRTLKVDMRADLSLSVECTNEDCEANYAHEYSAPDRERQSWLAEEGANWLASNRAHAKKTEKPWMYVWIEDAKGLIDGPASKTLKTLLRIYAPLRKEWRLSVADTREWIDESGWTPHGDVPYRHDGDAVPVLLRINLSYIAKQVRLSEKQVAKYLRMMLRIRLLRVAARLEHGQIVYQAGWWSHESGGLHSHARWFLFGSSNLVKSSKWARRLRHVSSGKIRLQ